MKNIQNEFTDAQFHRIMTEIEFRKNQNFRANKNNLYRTIQYIHNMDINEKAFEIIEYLIKEFGVSILLCFQPFYQKITKNHKARLEFKQKLQRISSLVNCQVKPYKCGELKFFNIEGKSKKAFNVKQKTPQELQFIKQLQFCRNCIIVKKQHPDLLKIPKDQQKHLKSILKWIDSKSLNPFAQYYLHKMLKKVLDQYKLQKIEGSTADQTQQERQERQRIQRQQVESQNQEKIKQTKRTRSHQKTRQGKGTGQINNQENDFSAKKSLQNKFQPIYKNQQKFDKIISGKNTQYGPNFANIPLCCRTFFFDQERILPGEDKRTQYKSYRFPFNPASIQTFKKTICAFLNTVGGQIYIGIKQTTNRKYRYVLGNYLTQNDKEQVLKSFRKITQSIFPNITQDLQVQFVPVRKTPFPDINLLGQVQTYFYDFSKKPLDLQKCPYRPARYVIRVRVPSGNKQSMYSYVETEYQLNKNTTSGEFIPFRSQNEVLVKEISQQVLRRYKQKLLYGQQKNIIAHNGPCMRPQIGDPKNEPEPEEQVMDAKQIEAVLYTDYMTKRKEGIERGESNLEMNENVRSYDDKNQKIGLKAYQKNIKSSSHQQEDMRTIFKYPLTFIVLRLPGDRLKRCIAKTPAVNYTIISQEINELTHQEMILISVDAYSHMEQFLRVKYQIQNHFTKENVQFIGASKIIKLQNSDNKRVVEDLLIKNKHKYVINKRNLQFYSLIVAASYLLFMRNMGFRVEAIPD